MHLEKQFDVKQAPAAAIALVAQDETLLNLFPDTQTEIVERHGNRRTLRSHYRALGQQGTATFHFEFEPSGEVCFEKVCDGRVGASSRVSSRSRRAGRARACAS